MTNNLPCIVLFSIGLIRDSEAKKQLSADKYLSQAFSI